jgi:glutathione synthase/RimK-type ligase-like ATP-grasp enzyme
MKYIQLFEEFAYKKNLESEYAKRVAWVMMSHDIRRTSGDASPREKRYGISAKGNLFLNYSTSDDYADDSIIVPPNVPIVYYGGHSDEKSMAFLKNKRILMKNVYNVPEEKLISGNKDEFAKLFKGFSWLPKTVFSREEAVDGAVGFPVVAKPKDGHSGLGIEKFDTPEELAKSKSKFDLYCQYIDIKQEYRVLFCRDKIVLINERVPTIEDDLSVRTKEAEEKISFTYVYQDLNRVDPLFIREVMKIFYEIKLKISLDLWALDLVVDKSGKMWVMETSSSTGLGSTKMTEVYKAVYEDFYGTRLPDDFLEDIYLKYVIPGHQNYWPKYRKEIESSPWAMDYSIITNPKAKNGYRYFYNLDK